MKLVITAIFCCLCSSGHAEEFRYNLMVTTGLQERVFDQHGKETTIVFSKDSDPEAQFLLSKILELAGVKGTKSREDWGGVPFEQAIILRGEILPKTHWSDSEPGMAEPENYQEFVLRHCLIKFPFSRHVTGKGFDTAYLETHFSFDTLFPDGLEFSGKKLDFGRYTVLSKPVGSQ